jgi:hypothetical protein
LFIIKLGTDRKYLLKDSGIFFLINGYSITVITGR